MWFNSKRLPMRKAVKRQKQTNCQLVPLTPELKAWADKWIRHSPFQIVHSNDVKDEIPPSYANANDAQMAWINAAVKIDQGVRELQAIAAAGNEDALGALVARLHDAISWLYGFPYRQPELVRKIARQKFDWPVLLANHSQVAKDNQEYIARIQLGEDCPYYSKSQRWGIGKWEGKWSTATIWAMKIQETIEANKGCMVFATPFVSRPEYKQWWDAIPQWAKDCATLPPLTNDTAAKWFKVGWVAILEYSNGKPEDVPELAALGAHRAKKSERSGQQKRATPRTEAANIRDGIKERIADALQSLAPSR